MKWKLAWECLEHDCQAKTCPILESANCYHLEEFDGSSATALASRKEFEATLAKTDRKLRKKPPDGTARVTPR